MCMFLSATSTHFKWELMLYCLHCPTLNKVFLLSYSYSYDLTLILALVISYIHYKMLDEVIDPFPNFDGATVEVWE